LSISGLPAFPVSKNKCGWPCELFSRKSCYIFAETLSNIHGSLTDGGFVMLYETTAAYTTCLWGLDERTWNFTDEREYGLWIAKPRWDRLWADAGFEQVIAHW